MSIFKSLFGQNEDDRLFEEYIKANQEMDVLKAQKCLDQMSDEGLLKAAFKIDKLAKSDPGYMILNILLFGAFTERPHLQNPFMKH